MQNVYDVISFCHPFTIMRQWHGVNLCDIVDGSDLWDINESAVRFAQRLGKQHETRTPTSNPRIIIRLLKHLWLWSLSLLLLQLPFSIKTSPHFVTAPNIIAPKNAHVLDHPSRSPFPPNKKKTCLLPSFPHLQKASKLGILKLSFVVRLRNQLGTHLT